MPTILESNTGTSSMMSKDLSATIPFSSDRKRKPFVKKYDLTPRGKEGINYIFEHKEGLNYRDLKIFLAIIKIAIDNRIDLDPNTKYNGFEEAEVFRMENVSIVDIMNIIGDKYSSKAIKRKDVFDSIKRLGGMDITMIDSIKKKEMNTRWTYAPFKADDDYRLATFGISRGTVYALFNGLGLSYSVPKLMALNGRSLLVYAYMQSRRHKVKNRYYYQDYLPHDELISVLDIRHVKNGIREQKRIIKDVLAALNKTHSVPMYKYEPKLGNWKIVR